MPPETRAVLPSKLTRENEDQMAETETTLKPGDVLRYTPHTRHCRHGIAVIDEGGYAHDTYWGDGEYSHVDLDLLTEAEPIFNMGDYRLARHRDEWEKYAEADRQWIPQGGYPERLLIRTAAEPDLETQIQNARAALGEAERELESAGRKIRWATEDLVKLEVQRNG